MIDKLLNKLTMYRLVLYYLVGLLALGAIFGAAGGTSVKPAAILETTAGLVILALLTNWAFSHLFRVWANHESTLITALILALIVNPADVVAEPLRFGIVIFSGVFAVASKYLLVFKKHHIFNPAALGVFVMGLLFQEYASWWVGQELLLPAVFVGGLLVLRKTNRFRFFFLFLAVFSVFLVVYGFAQGLPASQWGQNFSFVFLQSEVFFFVFAMLTEPITSPKRFQTQIIYLVVAAFFLLPQLSLGSLNFAPESALLLANFAGFLLNPARRYVLTLTERRKNGPNVESFVFATPKGLKYKPGQYMEWTLPLTQNDSRGNRRYLSLASSPTESALIVAARFPEKPSAFKVKMLSMKPGDTIVASEVSGDFVLPSKSRDPLVLIAGGIGVTPFRSMIRNLIDTDDRREVILIDSNSRAEDIAFEDVLCDAQRDHGIKIVHTLTDLEKVPIDWKGEKGPVDIGLIRRNVDRPTKSRYYLSGSPSFVAHVEKALRSAGVRRFRIHTDFFPGY